MSRNGASPSRRAIAGVRTTAWPLAAKVAKPKPAARLAAMRAWNGPGRGFSVSAPTTPSHTARRQ
ncbi:MAG: hypothetical protein U1F37_19980 [Alphaproteobacteria bacterium]